MTSLNFPITAPPVPPYDLEKEDNVLRSPTDGGYTITRSRFTRARTMPMTFKWQYLRGDEYLVLMDFVENVTNNGSLPFNFTLVAGSITRNYVVRFQKPPKTSYVGMDLWEVDIIFEEV